MMNGVLDIARCEVIYPSIGPSFLPIFSSFLKVLSLRVTEVIRFDYL